MPSIQPIANSQHAAASTAGKGFKYRDQRKRYPWWVKPVEKMTTETNDALAKKPGMPIYGLVQFQNHEEYLALAAKGYERLRDNIRNHVPGWRIQDVSLIFASGTYFAGGYTLAGDYYDGMEKIANIVSVQIHPPDKLGVSRWEGSELEASDMLETAAIHLGASQVGYAAVNPLWLPESVSFDPTVDKISLSKEMKTLIPERFKYVVLLAFPVPQAAAMRAMSPIGGAADRVGFEGQIMVRERVKNFIKGLGYEAINIPIPDNPFPFAVMAGLGEMGRMNRLISPVYGGALRISGIITDLPLALDKPIDFGLQEFCKRCKICAKACPANVLSMEDEPSWEPKDKYGLAGKKVWFEYGERCHTYNVQANHFCGACLASCCWTKENTWFHNLMRVIGAKMPYLSGLMAYFEKVFGYGPVPPRKWEDWWKLRLPVTGRDSFNVRRSR
jgi:reductive dehalogenase